MAITTVKKRLGIAGEIRQGESGDLLRSYVQQYNDVLDTMQWQKQLKGLSGMQRRAMIERHQDDLKIIKRIICALDAGFDPFSPPATWSCGPLYGYRGNIPAEARERIKIASRIFLPNRACYLDQRPEPGEQGISIYDPRREMFQPALCPIAVGYIRFGQQLHHFLIAQWDLDQDLEYLGASSRAASGEPSNALNKEGE